MSTAKYSYDVVFTGGQRVVMADSSSYNERDNVLTLHDAGYNVVAQFIGVQAWVREANPEYVAPVVPTRPVVPAPAI